MAGANVVPRVSEVVRVMHLIDTLEVGGAERSLVETLPRLRETASIVCHLYPGGRLTPALEAAGISVLPLDLPGKYAFGKAVRRVVAAIRAERPALLHATLFRAGMVARAAGLLTGVPVIDSFVNDSYAPERFAALDRAGRLKLRLVRSLDARSAGWVARFLAISRTTMRANCRALGVEENRCTVIYRGRDPARYADLALDGRISLRRSVGAGEGDELILCVARFLPRKGQEHLVRAFAVLASRRPLALLVLAGEGPDRSRCQALARGLNVDGRVRFLGTREDVPALLQAADAFAFPSLYEGLGGALVEAMLAACPIVASDTPVHRESVEPGVTGVLVPPSDPVALAAALETLLEDRARAAALGERARIVARERFDIGRIARRHDEFYHQVARESGR